MTTRINTLKPFEVIKTVEDLKNLSVFDYWKRLYKNKYFFIKKFDNDCFNIVSTNPDHFSYDGSLKHYVYVCSVINIEVEFQVMYLLQGTLKDFDYSLRFKSLEDALEFLVKKPETFCLLVDEKETKK